MRNDTADTLVIIPTYNELENIARMLDMVLAFPDNFHYLIVDDGSPDGTAKVVKAYMTKFPNQLFILERTEKSGLGRAYIAGFNWALARNYAYILEMDCDFSHNPKDLSRLKKACSEEGVSLSVGSRYVPGGRLENWPYNRVLLSYFASVYVRIITFMNVKDATAGFVCYKRNLLETIDLDKIRFVGYAFQIEMKYAAHSLGFKIKEIPITFTDRMEGNSKMSKGIVKEAIIGVLKMRWNSFFRTYKK